MRRYLRRWRCSLRMPSSRDWLAYVAVADPHSAGGVRVNRLLPSCDAFYDTYDVQPGDGMYVAPEDRVGIW